LADLVADGVPT